MMDRHGPDLSHQKDFGPILTPPVALRHCDRPRLSGLLPVGDMRERPSSLLLFPILIVHGK